MLIASLAVGDSGSIVREGAGDFTLGDWRFECRVTCTGSDYFQ
jgi:hypothetical protein